MNPIWQVIKEAATSKKFIVTVASVITAAAMKINLELSTEAVATILAPAVAYIIGQGWADAGKEATKVEGTIALIESGVPADEAKEKML
jgi:hypothetical protein